MKNFIVLLIGVMTFVSCKKDKTEAYTQAAKDATLAEQLTVDILREVIHLVPDYVVNQNYSGSNGIAISSTPEISSTTYPKTITINYGSGSTGNLGKARSGKLNIVINSANILSEDLQVSMDEFYNEGTQIIGNITFTHNSLIEGYDGELLNNGLSFINGNGTMLWEGTFTLGRISTSGTVSTLDDIYDYTSNNTGVDFSQKSFTIKTTTNHTIDFGCNKYINSGNSRLTPNGEDAQTVNYGSGNCEGSATISLSNGDTKNFTF